MTYSYATTAADEAAGSAPHSNPAAGRDAPAEPAHPGLAPPAWACRTPRQTAIVVADASGSMAGDKARAAAAAIAALLHELAQPESRDAFSVSLLTFDHRVWQRLDRVPAAAALAGLRGFDPTAGHGGRTDIRAALEEAERAVACALAADDTVPPAVVLFSDGGHNAGPGPFDVAARIRRAAELVAIAYDGGDDALLRALASRPQHFSRCQDGAALRQYLAAVGATLSRSVRRSGSLGRMLSAGRDGRSAGSSLAELAAARGG